MKYLTYLTLSLLALNICSCWQEEKKIDWIDYFNTEGEIFGGYVDGNVNEAKNALLEMEEFSNAFHEKQGIEKGQEYVGGTFFRQTRLYFVYTELGDHDSAMKCKTRAIMAVDKHKELDEHSGFKQETDEETWVALMELINALDKEANVKWRGFDKTEKTEEQPEPSPEN